MKVLLVEDEQKIADFVCSGLAARGLEVTHCDNGNTGLAHACQGSLPREQMGVGSVTESRI